MNIEWLKENYREGMHLKTFLEKAKQNMKIILPDPKGELTEDVASEGPVLLAFREYLEDNKIKAKEKKHSSGNFQYSVYQKEALLEREYDAVEFYEQFGIPRKQSALAFMREKLLRKYPGAKVGAGGRWSAEKDDTLLDLYTEGKSDEELTKEFNDLTDSARSEVEIRKRLDFLRPGWNYQQRMFAIGLEGVKGSEKVFMDKFQIETTSAQITAVGRRLKRLLAKEALKWS